MSREQPAWTPAGAALGPEPETARTRSARFANARRELRALFDEVAEVSWRDPRWTLFVDALAASEALAERSWSPERAAEAFELALRANGGLSADTFMASAIDPPPASAPARARRAAHRARRVASTLLALDRVTPDQRLLQRLVIRGGWLESEPLSRRDGRVRLALLGRARAYLVDVAPDAEDPRLEAALLAIARGEAPALPAVDPDAREATDAAAAIAVDPLPARWARSFHRLAWTRGGGPWMGVADAPPYAVVSTCHAAIDGYLHARVTSEVLRTTRASPVDVTGDEARVEVASRGGLTPPDVGFATRRLEGPAPRFAAAVHAFALVLEDRLGGASPGARTVPFHIPIAPGVRGDERRWRQRPLYGLLALRVRDGEPESVEELGARLPSFLARETAGAGVLTRVLRAALELPLPRTLTRRVIARQPWVDRWVAPTAVLTGGGYLSWMRFAPGEEPAIPTYPSAVPSFTDARGGAGLSIAHYDGGLAVGLTTSGPLGSSAAAEAFLDDWSAALRVADGR